MKDNKNKKLKMEMVDVEPTDFCDFSSSIPNREFDQKQKIKMSKKKKPAKGSGK